MSKTIELVIMAAAFTGDKVRTHRATVEDGIVRVYDDVAGHFTACHNLSSAAVEKMIRTADRVAKGNRPAFRTCWL
jgi:hypothetical protein